MSGIFGLLGLPDTDRSFVNVVGQRVVYDASEMILARYNADLRASLGMFVERTTEEFKWRYKLPGGGRLQRRGSKTDSAAVKATGQWDVAFPLEDFGAAIGGDDVTLAYMTLQEYDRHLDTVMIMGVNTVRWELMHRLFDNVQVTFVDPIHGNLLIEPLANGDAVVYPPVLGSETEATEDHYLAAGYIASAIDDTNNPYVTIRQELEHHFRTLTGGDNVVVWINPAQATVTEDLIDFDGIPDRFVSQGAQTAIPQGYPVGAPGRCLGRTNGCWVFEWAWMPADYMFGLHLGYPAPVIQREDPTDTGLPSGLNLVSRDENYPLEMAHYRHRFGLGVGNRLNGVLMHLTAGAFAIPAAYD